MEVQVAGENHDLHAGAKQLLSSEGARMQYVSHQAEPYRLEIVQRTDLVEVHTVLTAYDDCGTIRCRNTVRNVAARPITLESVSTITLPGFGKNGTASTKELYLYRFTNSWHVECQPRVHSLFELGLFRGNLRSMKRVAGCNTGSWSTKEELPQAILEDRESGTFTMFEIENNGSWYWEISDNDYQLYWLLSGPNQHFNQWSKVLQPGECFETVPVAICCSDSLDGVIGEMTRYRRHIRRPCAPMEQLPVIFNEYMHASWDNPSEENTRCMAPAVAETGAEYYVIDCGWHNEADVVQPYLGDWKDSRTRFPSGVKATIDYLHSLGLKAGLWLEPEAVGYLCEEMNRYYDKDCFFCRNGEKIQTQGHYQLDFRHPKVIGFMEELFRRLIVDYGVDYLKLDYNHCTGPGTECHSDSLGDGLLGHGQAYLAFLRRMMDTYTRR